MSTYLVALYQMKSKLILVGGGGHCKACIDVIESQGSYDIIGILEPNNDITEVLGYPVVGSDEDIPRWAQQGVHFLITVGQIKTVKIRKNIDAQLKHCDANMATVISPLAYISKHASIGPGTIVMHGALVSASARVGRSCIINTKSLIEHDAVVEDYCHVSTAAVVNGGAVLKDGTFFGSNAVSKEYVETATNDFIKAGSLFLGKRRDEAQT